MTIEAQNDLLYRQVCRLKDELEEAHAQGRQLRKSDVALASSKVLEVERMLGVMKVRSKDTC